MQKAIPTLFMRGGTSRGPFFLSTDLPSQIKARDAVLLAVMGSPDARQIDGLGGADPLTSKVGIVSRSSMAGVDVDFLFAQVLINEARVDTTPNCGNMLAAAGPFAIERGLVQAQHPRTTLRIRTLNTGTLCDVELDTPNGKMNYSGTAKIDGVPGTAAAIPIHFLDTAGSVCGSLLPTGKVLDVIDGIEVTCIDNGMPVVVLRAADVGCMGYESRDELNANTALKTKLEAIRLQAGVLMNLGANENEVRKKVVPKMTLVAAPKNGGAVCSRTFIPHDCHAAIGVLGAVSVATACVLPGSPAHSIAAVPDGNEKLMSVEHPTGEFSVNLTVDYSENLPKILRSALLRTARLIMRGEVYVDEHLFKKENV